MPECNNKKYYSTMKTNDISNWKIYHIMVDRFYNPEKELPIGCEVNDFLGGNLEGVMEKLSYIKELGFNAVMLTPVLKSEAYHGYHTTSYKEIDEHFGTWEVFHKLVEEVHSMGMAVICDCVLNHCHYKNPVFQNAASGNIKLIRDWFYFKNGKSKEYTSYLNLPDLPKFNLENADAANYMIDKVKMLAATGIDGIRLDHTIGLPFSFLRQLRKELHKVNPELKIIGEVWAGGCTKEVMTQFHFKNCIKAEEYINNGIDQECLQQDYIDVLDGVLDFRFREIILEEVKGEGYSGYMMVVLDPSRVIVGSVPATYGSSGYTVEEMVHRFDAVAGTNAGGFYDPEGRGNGSSPDTLVVFDGKTYYAGSGTRTGFVGIDSNHILHVSKKITEAEIIEKDIRYGVCFGPVLIINGEPCDINTSGVNPRTAIGQRSDGAMLLLVIDGRQVISMGATMQDLVDIMLDYGAVNACNLDGGSSTLMWYDGGYVNNCASVIGIRPVPTAILVLKEGANNG